MQSFIGLALSLGKTTQSGHKDYGTVWGANVHHTSAKTVWNVFVALGNAVFSFNLSPIVIEITNTLAQPPSEAKSMKRAVKVSISISVSNTDLTDLLCTGVYAYLIVRLRISRNRLLMYRMWLALWECLAELKIMKSHCYAKLGLHYLWYQAFHGIVQDHCTCKQCAVHCIPTDVCLLYSWHSIFLLASSPTQVSMLFTWKIMINVRHRPQHWPLSMLILVTSSHDKMKLIIKLGLSSHSFWAHAGTAAVSSIVKLNHNLGQLQSALSARPNAVLCAGFGNSAPGNPLSEIWQRTPGLFFQCSRHLTIGLARAGSASTMSLWRCICKLWGQMLWTRWWGKTRLELFGVDGTVLAVFAGNLLTGFGFFNPYWIITSANIFVFIHLIGGYQVYLQPFMAFVETRIKLLFPNVPYLYNEYSFHCPGLGLVPISILRLVSRSIIVCMTTVIVSYCNLSSTHACLL